MSGQVRKWQEKIMGDKYDQKTEVLWHHETHYYT